MFKRYLLLAFILVNGPSLAAATEDPKNVIEQDLWSTVRVEWGQYAAPDTVDVLHQDVTCDGKDDYVASRVNLDNPDGPFFDLMVVSAHTGDVRAETVSLGFDGANNQFGLCAPDDREPYAEIFIEPWDVEEVADVTGMEACNIAVSVVDGMCDTPRFFWSFEAKPEEPHLIFFRH